MKCWRRSPGWRGPEAAIEAMLADPQIEFLTLRNAEAGCFIARVERRQADDDWAI
jgi:hypothetical protein